MTAFTLKIIAILAMTLDHTASIIGQVGLFPDLPVEASFALVKLMHGIGRIAFPIFAFLIAEGAGKTRSMPKYIGRLALFAVISEPVFYFSHWTSNPTLGDFLRNMVRLRWGNVFFTLALGATAIYIYQQFERKQFRHRRLWSALMLLAIAFFGWFIRCDYGLAGVLLIAFLYLARTRGQKCLVVLVWTMGLYGLSQSYNPLPVILGDCLYAASSCLFIWFYNGKRGKNLKWSFYAYYPLHLLVLTLLHGYLG